MHKPLSEICLNMKDATAQSLERPDEEEAEVTARETQAAFDKIVANRISAAQPKTLPAQPGAPTYIKYTPAQQVRREAASHKPDLYCLCMFGNLALGPDWQPSCRCAACAGSSGQCRSSADAAMLVLQACSAVI